MELEPLRGLIVQPLLKIAAGAAAGNDSESLTRQPLAYGRPDTAHPSGYVCKFASHSVLLVASF
jgi:hypothetical protein